MKNLAKALAVALLFSFGAAAPADANGWRGAQKQTAQKRSSKRSAKTQRARRARAQRRSPRAQKAQKQISHQKASAMIRAKLKAEGKSTNVTTRKTQTHKKMTEHTVANNKTKKVTKMQVSKNGKMVRRAGGKMTQAQARAVANKQMRRQNAPNKGTFSGVVNQGITKNGNYKFRSKTDKNEVVYVNANTGAVRRVDK